MTPGEMRAPTPVADGHKRYWRRVQRLTTGLLLAWFGVSFGFLFYARELSAITLFGWPVSFYMAAQGLTLFYVLLVAVYVLGMRRLDNTLKAGSSHAP
jgi:putative solute:sodium symporter small subunit